MDQIAVRSPQLDELVYTVLYQMPYKYVRLMEEKYVKATMTEKAARRFANTCTREEMEYVLSHAGIEFFYVLSPKNMVKEKLVELLRLFHKGQTGKALDNIIQNHIFVHSDPTFMRLLSLSASVIHHPNYFLNVEAIRAGSNLKSWKKRNISDASLQIREADEMNRYVARDRYNTINTVFAANFYHDLSEVECAIILRLYSTNLSMGHSDFLSEMRNAFSAQSISKAFDNLRKAHLVTKDMSSEKNKILLTGLGIKKASTILSEINKKS